MRSASLNPKEPQGGPRLQLLTAFVVTLLTLAVLLLLWTFRKPILKILKYA